jgi:hypothetical protein
MRCLKSAFGLLALVMLAEPAQGQDTKIRGFTDVRFDASDAPGVRTAFGLGQFDLYITSALSPRVAFLAETVFEFDADFEVDVERVALTYRLNPHLELSAGKQHTPFSYWNTGYHHGSLLQPSIDRPLAVSFEDDGGPLPVHTTGLLLAGHDLTPLHLGFHAMVGNGIGSTPVSDDNDAKSLTLQVTSQVTSEFSVGASWYHDRISDGTASLSGVPLTQALQHDMVSVFAAYFHGRIEALGEYHRVGNGGTGVSRRWSDLYYLHAGCRAGDVVGYLQYNQLRFAAGDTYLDLPNAQTIIVGVRLDLGAAAGLKAEYRRGEGGGSWSNGFAAQFTVGF